MNEELIADEQAPPDKFARFSKGGTYYAWILVPSALMDTPVPEGTGIREAEGWGKVQIGTDDEGPVYRQKTMREFLLQSIDSLDGEYTIAPLAPMEAPTMRTKRVTREDIAAWEPMLLSYGLTVDKWLDIEQYKELIYSSSFREV